MSRCFCLGKKDFCDGIEDCLSCEFANWEGSVKEDEISLILSKIFGEDYNIDRLKELVEADREEKCVVLPCKDWLEIVFGEQEVFYGIDDDYEEEKIREITVRNEERFTWLNGWETVILNGTDENGLDWEFTPDEIGKTVFLTREEAEAALERIEGEEK